MYLVVWENKLFVYREDKFSFLQSFTFYTVKLYTNLLNLYISISLTLKQKHILKPKKHSAHNRFILET